MYYEGPYRGGGRITLSSILLLIIFVTAAAVLIAAVVWRPWFDDDAPPVVQAEPAQQITDGQAAPADGAPAQVQPVIDQAQ